MSKIVVGLDADNTLLPFKPMWDRFLDFAGHTRGVGDKNQWNFYEGQGFTHEEFKELCIQGVNQGIMFLDGWPYEGTFDAMWRMAEHGWHIHIITDRGFGGRATEAALLLTKKWLEKWELPYDDVTITADKGSVDTHYFIDDLIDNYDVVDSTGSIVYLIDAPWNQDDGSRRRVKTLSEFVDQVERHVQG